MIRVTQRRHTLSAVGVRLKRKEDRSSDTVKETVYKKAPKQDDRGREDKQWEETVAAPRVVVTSLFSSLSQGRRSSPKQLNASTVFDVHADIAHSRLVKQFYKAQPTSDTKQTTSVSISTLLAIPHHNEEFKSWSQPVLKSRFSLLQPAKPPSDIVLHVPVPSHSVDLTERTDGKLGGGLFDVEKYRRSGLSEDEIKDRIKKHSEWIRRGETGFFTVRRKKT